MQTNSLLKFGLLSLALLSLISFVSAWGAYVPNTWNSNQLYAGSYTVPSSDYSAWTYNAYFPSSGYPVLGGGTYHPYGYHSGSYVVPVPRSYSVYSYNSYPYMTSYGYYGAPIHTTSDAYYRCAGYYGC